MKRTILIVMLVLAGVSLVYCQHFWFPYTWHQKRTLEVEADGQRYTSVVEVSWRKTIRSAQPMGQSASEGYATKLPMWRFQDAGYSLD